MYIWPLDLENVDVGRLIASECEVIERCRVDYLRLLCEYQSKYNEAVSLASSDSDRALMVVNDFMRELPEILMNNQDFSGKSGGYRIQSIREFFDSEITRIEGFRYKFELVVADLANETRDNLKNKILENTSSDCMYIYILKSISGSNSHYSIVVQTKNSVTTVVSNQGIVLDPLGKGNISNGIFEDFININASEVKFTRITSRTQFKINEDCELLSVYMASHLIRLTMLNPHMDAFYERKEQETKLLTPVLWLFSEKFCDYFEPIQRKYVDGVEIGDKIVESHKRKQLLENTLIPTLKNDKNVLFISCNKTIQQTAIEFLKETITFIEDNKNMYEKTEGETKKAFITRIKQLEKNTARPKFGYAIKLYSEYLKQQHYHETLLMYHDWSKSEIVPHMSELIDRLPPDTKTIVKYQLSKLKNEQKTAQINR